MTAEDADGASTARDKEAQEIVEAAEFGARNPRWRVLRWLLVLLAISWSIFQVYAIYTGGLNPQKLGAIHLAFGFGLAFLAFPRKNGPTEYIPWYDWLLALAGSCTALYIYFNYYNLVAVQGGLPITRDVWMGSILIVVLAIAAIRMVGYALPVIAGLVVLYGLMGPAGVIPVTPPDVLYLHNGYSWKQII